MTMRANIGERLDHYQEQAFKRIAKAMIKRELEEVIEAFKEDASMTTYEEAILKVYEQELATR